MHPWILSLLLATAFAPRQVTAPRCAIAPTLDGRLDDACWAAGTWCDAFTQLNRPDLPAKVPTHFQLCCDGQRLYVAVRADEPNLARLKAVETQRDGKVFRDDVVEVLIDAANEQTEYLHFAINPLGTLYDSQVRQGGHVHTPEWNGHVEVKTGREPGAWTVELAVPLAELGLGRRSLQGWGLNVARERQTVDPPELSTFAPLTGGFHQPTLFAHLTLQDVDLSRFLWGLPGPSARQVVATPQGLVLEAKARVTNQTGQPRSFNLLATLAVAGRPPAQETVVDRLGAGESKVISLAVPLAQAGPARLTLAVTDPATGAVWSVRQEPLDASYTPIAIRLTRPSYRDTIYATEQLAALDGTVTLGLPERELPGKTLRVALLDGPRCLAETTVAKPARTTSFRLALPALAPGAYAVTAELRAGGQVVHQASRTLRRAAPSPVEVRIDEHQVTRVNGRRYLPYGWFSATAADYATIAAYGCNAVFEYNAQYLKVPELRAQLDRAQAAGLKVAFYPYPNGSFHSAEVMRRPLSAEEAEAVRQRVRAIKDHPAVLGYYLADEPEGVPALPARFVELRRVIAEEDPYHPCIMLNDSLDGIRKYAGSGDVLMPDPYPLFLRGGRAAQDLAKTSQFVAAVAEASEGWRGAWVTPQGFNYGDYNALNNRIPTLAEMRNQEFQAFIGRATGLLWYTYSQASNYPELQLGMPFLTREARRLEPWLLAPETSRPVAFTPAAAPLKTTLRTANGRPLILAVNTGTQPVDAVLTLPQGASATWHVVSEARALTAVGGQLRDRFEPYATHLYSPDAALGRGPTLAETERAIAAANAARRKPGNLAFEDSGATVAVSSSSQYGSTPPRVLDGMIGGMVWRDNTPGKTPDWLQVNFPGPATVGRVVVYSATVRAGTIQAQDGDTWVDLAPLTPDGEGRLTATFTPRAMPALRVNVTGVDGPWTTISEVEAYAR